MIINFEATEIDNSTAGVTRNYELLVKLILHVDNEGPSYCGFGR